MRKLFQDQEETAETEYQLTHSLTTSHTHSNVINHMMLYTSDPSSQDSSVPTWKMQRQGGGGGGVEFPPPGKEKMCHQKLPIAWKSFSLGDVCFPWPLYYFISWWFPDISYLRMYVAHLYKPRFLQTFFYSRWVLKPTLTAENLCFWHHTEWKKPNIQHYLLHDSTYNEAHE